MSAARLLLREFYQYCRASAATSLTQVSIRLSDDPGVLQLGETNLNCVSNVSCKS